MSPVPSFDNRGLIPPLIGSDETTHDRAPYTASVTELPTSLGTTPWRESLLFGLLEYRALLTQHGYANGLQFVDGSFVENVEVRKPSRGKTDFASRFNPIGRLALQAQKFLFRFSENYDCMPAS